MFNVFHYQLVCKIRNSNGDTQESQRVIRIPEILNEPKSNFKIIVKCAIQWQQRAKQAADKKGNTN